MKAFTVNVEWTAGGVRQEFDLYNICRDQFIGDFGSRHMRYFPEPTGLKLSLAAPSCPLPALQEIANLGGLEYSITEEVRRTVWGDLVNFYSLFGNDESVVFGMYWLILAERLQHYHTDSMLQMMRSSVAREDWDYQIDKKNSIRLWKEFLNGRYVTSNELFQHRTGPINIRRSVKWNTV